MTTLSTFESWSLVLGLALGTFLIRYSFIGLFGDRDMPAWLDRALKLMVPAIFAAIVFSGVAIVNGALGAEVAGLVFWPRYVAAAVALLAAVFTRGNMLVTLGVGMATLHGLPWLFR
jgi:branched-subunit amino acid transport protein